MMDEIIDILKNHTTVPAGQITAGSRLADDLGLNSYSVVNLICEFEDKFDIEIPDEDIPALQTVGDIEVYITAKAQNK